MYGKSDAEKKELEKQIEDAQVMSGLLGAAQSNPREPKKPKIGSGPRSGVFRLSEFEYVAGCSIKRNSFAGDTRVLMASGAPKAINDVRVGDKVQAYDPDTGLKSERIVAAKHVNRDNDLTDLTVRHKDKSTSTIRTTQGHLFWAADEQKWYPAAKLTHGMLLGLNGRGTVVVERTANYQNPALRFDLTVEGVHTYHVAAGSDAVLVHNSGGTVGVCPLDPDVNHGRIGELASKDRLKSQGYTNIVEQVRFINSDGNVFIADFVARHPSGRLVAIEAKTGRGSELSLAQELGYGELHTVGAVLDTSRLEGPFGIQQGRKLVFKVEIDLWTCPICGSAAR